MEKKYFVISLIAIVASFAGGFLVANALNRSEIDALQSKLQEARSAPSGTDETTISDEELRSKIADADKNASNFDYQKNLGLALYKYGSMKRDTKILDASVRILERAASLKEEDLDVVIGLGNAHFDIGYFGKNTQEIVKAREQYERALAKQSADAEVRTDLGLTYFLDEPPDDPRAISEFEKALKVDPKHTKTLEFLIQSLVRTNKLTEAEKYLAQLRAADPSAGSIAGLDAMLNDAKTKQGQK